MRQQDNVGRCEVEMTDEVKVRVESNQALASCLLGFFFFREQVEETLNRWSYALERRVKVSRSETE